MVGDKIHVTKTPLVRPVSKTEEPGRQDTTLSVICSYISYKSVTLFPKPSLFMLEPYWILWWNPSTSHFCRLLYNTLDSGLPTLTRYVLDPFFLKYVSLVVYTAGPLSLLEPYEHFVFPPTLSILYYYLLLLLCYSFPFGLVNPGTISYRSSK